MKRKDKQKHYQQPKNIEYLERKLEEEKAILAKENKRLQKQIYEEIEENNFNRIKFEKKEQGLLETIQKLTLENQRLKSQLLVTEQARNPDDDEQEQTLELLKSNKQILQENAQLKTQLQEYMDCLMALEQEKQKLEEENKECRGKVREEEKQIKNLRNQIEKNRDLYQQLRKESSQTREELEIQINTNEESGEALRKLEAANAHLKKKNKQFSEAMNALEAKFHELQTQQISRFETEIADLKRSKQSLQQEEMMLNRKIGFLEVAVSQKEAYIQTLKRQIDDLKEATDSYADKFKNFEEKYVKSENQNRRLVMELENQRSKTQRQVQQIQRNLDEEIEKAKKKVAEDMFLILKSGEADKSHKHLQNYMQGLRSYKSQAHIRPDFCNPKLNDERSQLSYEKIKYQNQINSLNAQNQSLKRQLEQSLQDLSNLKKQYQNKRDQSEEQDKKIRELQLTIERNEHQKAGDEQKLRLELRNYRNKETEFLERTRQYADREEAMNLKVSYYDKKIKEYIQNIERKDHIVENLKHQRLQLQNKAKFLEDKLAVAIEENQSLRKFKNDTNRKDELLKDYKERLEKCKKQSDALRGDLEKIRKQKSRIERNLESKEDYIKTLKEKNVKDLEERENTKEDKIMKEAKEKYEGKLKKLKKQCEGYDQIVEAFRLVIIEKIEESIKKYIGKESTHTGSWEAAEVLGLKSSEMEEFVNPTVNLDRHICEDLDRLWQRGQYEQFMRSSIDYLILKNQGQGKLDDI